MHDMSNYRANSKVRVSQRILMHLTGGSGGLGGDFGGTKLASPFAAHSKAT
jgi:hypothetical protein